MSNSIISDTLSDNEYYHGTMDYKAIQILYEGFRLKKQYSDYGRYGTFKEGLYLSKSLEPAALFGYTDIIFTCVLKMGISILKIDESYDKKVIDSLKREFGKDILTGDLSKVIPRNKHLTRKELINLLNYRFAKTVWHKTKDIQKWRSALSSVKQQLSLHKFDAIGMPDTEAGVAVFNPTFVKPIAIYHVKRDHTGKAYLLGFNKSQFVSVLRKDIEEFRDPDDTADMKEWDHVESLLDRYLSENNLDKAVS